MSPIEENLPDEIVLGVLSYASTVDLVNFHSTNRRFRALDTDDLWKALCHHQWQAWPMYCDDNPFRQLILEGGTTWKLKYQLVENDVVRTELTLCDLEQLKWEFSFLPWAGGSPGNSSPAYFHQGRVHLLKYLWMYPRLDYRLVVMGSDETGGDDGASEEEMWAALHMGLDRVLGEPLQQAVMMCVGARSDSTRHSSKQSLQIGEFPPHYVARTSSGGWIIWNENIYFFADGASREAQLPDQLQIHLEMFSFG